MRAIVIVSTQLQFINCVECLMHIKAEECDIILYANSRERMRQLEEITQIDCYKTLFTKVYKITKYYSKDRFVPWFLFFFISYLTRKRKYDACIIGHYLFSVDRHLLRMTKKFNNNALLYVVDDGAASIIINELRREELLSLQPFRKLKIEGKLLRLYMEAHAKEYVPDKLVFYTSYQLDKTGRDVYIKNDYEYIKRESKHIKIDSKIQEADIIILGQPFYLTNVISKEKYVYYIEYVANLYKESNIVYCLHPEESNILFKNCKNIKIIKNKFSIEIMSLFLPKCYVIVGFNTSALFSLPMFRPDIQYLSILVKKEDVKADCWSTFEDCYSSLANSNIKFIKIK